MGHKHLTADTKTAICALYKAGKNATEISQILGVGKSTADKVRFAAGIPAHHEKMSIAQKRAREIKRNKAVAPAVASCDPTRAAVDSCARLDGNNEKEVVKRILCNLIDRLYDSEKGGA